LIFKFLRIRPYFQSSINLFFTLTQPLPFSPLHLHDWLPFLLQPFSTLISHPIAMADKPSQQTADALFLLDALQHVTSTVVVSHKSQSTKPPSLPHFSLTFSPKYQINAGEIAAQKDAKVNTIQKRFTTLKQRYNLNIQTTAVGGTGSAIPPKPKASRVTKKAPSPKKAATKKTSPAKAAAIAAQLDESDDGSATAIAVKFEDDEEEMPNDGTSASPVTLSTC
jgi:hypothetical protein